MFKEVFEVDEQGFIIENYLYSEKEIQDAIDNGRLIVTKGWYDQEQRLFTPKWDFEAKQWLEGLSPEEVVEREARIEKQNKKLSTTDMNAVALMELTSEVYEGGG